MFRGGPKRPQAKTSGNDDGNPRNPDGDRGGAQLCRHLHDCPNSMTERDQAEHNAGDRPIATAFHPRPPYDTAICRLTGGAPSAYEGPKAPTELAPSTCVPRRPNPSCDHDLPCCLDSVACRDS